MEFNKVYSYIISPPDEITTDVKELKLFVKRVIGAFPSEKSKAHITLRTPYPEQQKVMTNRIRRLRQDLQNIPSVKLRINGFDNFINEDGKHVIYAKVETDDHLKNWLKELKIVLDDTKRTVPHLTIARGISTKQFNVLWPRFEKITYKKSFTANALTILKNNMIGEGASEICSEIPFGRPDTDLRSGWTLF